MRTPGTGTLGAARRQALTGLVMATLLGPGDAQVRAAIAESRQLFEQMGAGLWLARLDAAERRCERPLLRPRPSARTTRPGRPRRRARRPRHDRRSAPGL